MRMKTFWPRKRLLNGWADSEPLFLLATEDGLDSLTKSLAAKSIKWLCGIILIVSILLGFD